MRGGFPSDSFAMRDAISTKSMVGCKSGFPLFIVQTHILMPSSVTFL